MIEDYKVEQDIAYKLITNAIKKDRVSHIYLLETNGVSYGLTFAKAFAKALMCPNNNIHKKEECEKCNLCNIIDDGNCLELKIIEPDGMWIKKEQIENLQYLFSKKSIIGNKKIYIINEVEKMKDNVSNSLLKFIEEPEDGIIGILVTDNINNILNTIKSRCQIISLKNKNILNADENNLINLINDKLEKNDLKMVFENSNELIDIVINFINKYERIKKDIILYINDCWHSKIKDRKIYTIAFDIIILYYKDILSYKLSSDIKLFKDYIEDIKSISNNNSYNNLVDKIEKSIRIKNIIKNNVNLNLMMDKYIIELEKS